MQAITVTPSTTLLRLMAPSISAPIMFPYLQVAAALARQGGANLLAVGDIGLADRDQLHLARKAGHPDAVLGLFDEGHRRERDAPVGADIADALTARGVQHQGRDRHQVRRPVAG